MEALFRYASMGIIVTNREGDIVLANPFALKQFGYENNELHGKKIEAIVPERFHKKHIENCE